MTWTKIAKKDFRDAVQSRALWALVGVFVVLSLVSTYAYVELPEFFGEPGGATFPGLVLFTVGLLGLFIPIAAIVVCFKSVAGERESGSAKILLSLPTTRTNVLVGKLVGRGAVLVVGMGVGIVIGLVVGALLLGSISIQAVGALVIGTILFIAAYASIVVGLSALTGSTSRATTYALGFFVVVELLWDAVMLGVLYIVGGFSMPTDIPEWFFPFTQLSPSSAYLSSVISLLPAAGFDDLPNEAVDHEGQSILLSTEIGYIVLLMWIAIPAIVAYQRFNAADL